MKQVAAIAFFLIFAACVQAQTDSKQVTVTLTSYVYGNRYCARLPIVAVSLSKTFGGDRGEEGLPGPTGDCSIACTDDGARYLAVLIDDKGLTYKAKDTAKLRDQCGKKVTVSGMATPSGTKDEFIIEIESVKPYVEPVKKALPESNAIDNEFGNAAVLLKVFIESLYNGERKFTTAKIDEQKADAKRLIRSTADQAMWDLLLSYNYHVRRYLVFDAMAVGEEKKTAAEMRPMLEKCSDYATTYLNERKAPRVTECTKLP